MVKGERGRESGERTKSKGGSVVKGEKGRRGSEGSES